MHTIINTVNRVLAPFHLAIFRFDLQAQTSFQAPFTSIPYRGALGHALRRISCRQPGENCPDCDLASHCAYGYIFETTPSRDATHARKFSSFPRPYVINTPAGFGRLLSPGDNFGFDLTLIGHAVAGLPAVVAAFEEIGAGEGLGPGGGKFKVRQVCQYLPGGEIPVYTGDTFGNFAPPFDFGEIPDSSTPVNQVTLRLLTPLRLDIRGKLLQDAPSFRVLMETLLRRLLLTNYLHCGGEYLDPPEELLHQTEAIAVAETELHWQELDRHSSRQQKTMKMGGLRGHITYSGDLGPFVPLLRLGELLNIGKSTTDGLGRYRLEV